jgi:hypothetical protein
MIINNWSPISAWFKDLWAQIRPIMEPMLKFFGGGEGGPGLVASATAKVQDWTAQQRVTNAGAGGGTGAFVQAGAGESARQGQLLRNATQGGANTGQLLRPPGAGSAPGSLLRSAAANSQTNLQGQLTVKFENPPPGVSLSASKTNQPGVNVSGQVGRRSLSGG